MSFAAHVLTHRRYRRRHVLALVMLIVLIAWGSYWGMVAVHFNSMVDSWVEASKQSGSPLSFTERSTDGTPLNVHVHLDQFQYAHKGSLELKADEAVLYLNLWDWNTVSVKLRRNIQGVISELPFTAEVLKIGFAQPENPPINDMETGLSIWVQTMGLTLQPKEPLALGNRMDHLSFDMRVMGVPPDFTKTEAIRAWNNASGVLEFDQLDVAWGPLGLSAKGTIGLNTQLQPEGAFSGKVEGLDNAIDILVTNGVIEQRQQAILRSSISVLSRPSGSIGTSPPIVPISVQGGGLYLGPVRILTIPPIVWPGQEPVTSAPTPQPTTEPAPLPAENQ